MSLKSVEMQLAIPRTKEAGVVQNQLYHKPMVDQAALAAGAMQQTEQQRRKAGKVEESVPKRIKDGSGERREKPPSSAKAGAAVKKSGSKPADEPNGHPFKGRHIDLSL